MRIWEMLPYGYGPMVQAHMPQLAPAAGPPPIAGVAPGIPVRLAPMVPPVVPPVDQQPQPQPQPVVLPMPCGVPNVQPGGVPNIPLNVAIQGPNVPIPAAVLLQQVLAAGPAAAGPPAAGQPPLAAGQAGPGPLVAGKAGAPPPAPAAGAQDPAVVGAAAGIKAAHVGRLVQAKLAKLGHAKGGKHAPP